MLLRAMTAGSGHAARRDVLRPALQYLAMAGKGDRRQAIWCEPPDFLHLITRRGLTADQPGAIRKKDDAFVVDDDVLHWEQLEGFDSHLHFFAALAHQRGFRMLIPVDVAARQSPQPSTRLDVAPTQKDPAAIFDQRNDDDLGIAEGDPGAFRTGAQGLLRHQPRLGLRSAAGAVGDHRVRLRRHPAGTTIAAAASLIASPIKKGKSPKSSTFDSGTK